MGRYNEIIVPMKRRYVSYFLKIEKLSGLFLDASAGGIVWKERKGRNKQRESQKKNNIVKYAYYQFYDKRKQKGKRKIQRYIRKKDMNWAIQWINERRKKWINLKILKQEIKKIVKGLSVFSVSIRDLEWEIKAQKLKKALNKARKKPFTEGCHYMTVKGDLVRSRAERKIANELYNKSISYEYEKRISVQGKKVLPDFIILNKGKIIIWEHLGMLDIPEYASKWERKKLFYESIGFVEGINLIVTTDKSLDGLSIAMMLSNLK